MANSKAPRTDDDRLVDTKVGERIRIARQAAGLTQGQLAGQAGVTFQQLQKYETGTNRVAASRLVRIAGALGIRASALLGEGGGVDHRSSETRRAMEMFERCTPQSRKTVLALLSNLSTAVQA